MVSSKIILLAAFLIMYIFVYIKSFKSLLKYLPSLLYNELYFTEQLISLPTLLMFYFIHAIQYTNFLKELQFAKKMCLLHNNSCLFHFPGTWPLFILIRIIPVNLMLVTKFYQKSGHAWKNTGKFIYLLLGPQPTYEKS